MLMCSILCSGGKKQQGLYLGQHKEISFICLYWISWIILTVLTVDEVAMLVAGGSSLCSGTSVQRGGAWETRQAGWEGWGNMSQFIMMCDT